jgi:NADH dehydrogenase
MRRPPHATDAPHRVVIVGGGFGGLYAAKALRRAPVEVTLVDRAGHHLFQPLLSQVATGALAEDEIAVPLDSLLQRQRNATVVPAEVADIDLDARRLEPLDLEYDSLIVAAGTVLPDREGADGAHLAPGLKSLDDAREIRSRVLFALEMAELTADPAWRHFAVVGGGPTGVDLAARIARLAPLISVTLLEVAPELLPDFPASRRRRAARDLARLGVDVRLGAAAAALDPDGLDLADSGRVDTRTVLWAAGVAPSPLARTLADAGGARLDAAGRVVVMGDLTLPRHPEVFAIGDMAASGGAGDAAAAMQQGRHAARVIGSRLAGRRTPGTFRLASHGSLKARPYNPAVTI